jgi:hypothetical protein
MKPLISNPQCGRAKSAASFIGEDCAENYSSVIWSGYDETDGKL